MPYVKKPPLKLLLEDYRLMEQIINEIEEPRLTDAERNLRLKIRQIASNIERAIAFSTRRHNAEPQSQD